MVYWFNILKNYKKSKIDKKIIKEKKLTDLKLKKINDLLIKKKIEDDKLKENLNEFKDKINQKDINNLNNWDFDKEKNNLKINKLIKSVKTKKLNHFDFLFSYNNYLIKLLIKNLEIFDIKNSNTEIVFNKYKLFYLYKKINLKKLINIRKKNLYSLIKTVNIILDTRSLKTKMFLMVNGKPLMFTSNGLIFKKLQLKSKKYKKSEKLSFVFLKNVLLKFNFFKKYNNIIITIKGLKKNTNTLVNYINKNIKNNYNRVIYINNFKFSKNKFFKFKKLKAIKKKIKKKIIKYK